MPLTPSAGSADRVYASRTRVPREQMVRTTDTAGRVTAHGDHLCGIPAHKGGHEPGRQQADQTADDQAEEDHPEHRPMGAGADAVPFFRPVVLGHEGGEGVAEVLNRHVGDGVDLHRHGEGGHDRGTEAVHQALDR